MRWEVIAWAALAVVLFAAEALLPGAFMLWMGIAAAVVFALVWLFDGMSLLLQVVLFVVLSFVSIQVYRTWFRKAARQSDQPLLNRRAEQLVGRVVVLEQAIVDGSGRAKVDDALWVVAGPDLPVDSRVRVVAVDGMTLKVQPA
ncbi:NfeD family protein [Stenotrophomonas sp. ATCM1_4]|jgi:membrane protein implicated in regulation of membrane protease activity|uniref:NfeD family protein n=1 Tax=Stenotrophomonas capsici TaxID=3110230 RepID=A0ABU5V5V8_9GAMM|nr:MULTISPECIES: NfeD family protein [unclassified Stenotrophomonas]MBD9536311.1 NfeD family protein [Stenotrophomonas sp. STM01]MEA5668743.1 NfeD family protein [Stenotrophomonas sp. MH1]TDB28846.1 NfeD family protein [Stenotrophomonas sp. ATCM1_4]